MKDCQLGFSPVNYSDSDSDTVQFVSDLVGNPEDRFSQDAAHLVPRTGCSFQLHRDPNQHFVIVNQNIKSNSDIGAYFKPRIT